MIDMSRGGILGISADFQVDTLGNRLTVFHTRSFISFATLTPEGEERVQTGSLHFLPLNF